MEGSVARIPRPKCAALRIGERAAGFAAVDQHPHDDRKARLRIKGPPADPDGPWGGCRDTPRTDRVNPLCVYDGECRCAQRLEVLGLLVPEREEGNTGEALVQHLVDLLQRAAHIRVVHGVRDGAERRIGWRGNGGPAGSGC